MRGLYVITDPILTPPDLLEKKVRAALLGGAAIVQYRNKDAGAKARRLQEAQSLRALTDEYGALLIINDDTELALACNADGVHVGLEDTPIALARAQLGLQRIVGATCHGDTQLALRAIEEGADYVAFGRFFGSNTKPDAPPAALDAIRPALSRLTRPAVAIGGIRLENAQPLVNAGFAMLAVVGDVFSHDSAEITLHCAAYARLFQNK
ncbi:Thiamine-phosphate pyrophosphorylase [gamma proteobacterium HdN1]|nr:Thiamine-phosphate pyrophosphorylase [gamma proteobacterium HdN1]